MKIDKVILPEDIRRCMDIRRKVFVEGQNVSIDLELDGKDCDSDHYLLLSNNQPAGTARIRYIDNYAKIERVAVLDTFQGQGFGKAIMQAILADLNHKGIVTLVKLSSQTAAIPFYEKLGFIICSEEYIDAGIPHKDMKLELNHLLT